MKRIEELLQHSRRTPQTLSAQEKERMFSVIQKNAAPASVTKKAAPAQERSWMKRIGQWFIVVPLAAAAAVLIMIFNQQESDTNSQIIVQIQGQERIQHTNTNTPDEPEETNTNEEDSSEQPEEQQEEAPQEQEIPDEIAEKPTPPELENSDDTVLRDVIIDEMFGGYGGGSDDIYSLWQLILQITLSHQQSMGTEYEGYSLNDTQLKQFASAFGLPADYFDVESISQYEKFVNNLTPEQEQVGTENCSGYGTDLPIPRCIYVNNSGFIMLLQQPSAAQPDGLTEALTYIQRLTGLTRDQLNIQTQSPENIPSSGYYDVYYNVYPKGQETPGINYQSLGWHFALKENKLVSFFGVHLEIHQSQSAPQYELISEAEAYDRLRSDFARQTAEGGNGWMWSFFNGNPTVEPITLPNEDVRINIQSVKLRYELFTRTAEANEGRIVLRVLPVYHITGVEENTGIPFNAFIDATVDQHLLNTYSLIRDATSFL